MKVSIIVAVSENNVIGSNNQLPWHLPGDMKHFKNTTTGHHVIMGRKNYESMGKPLPNRINIVLSKQQFYNIDECIVASSIAEALTMANRNDEQETFIIGGGELFKHALPLVDSIYLTRIHATIDGDVFFPALNKRSWKVVSKQAFQADEKNKYAYTIFKYAKIRSAV